MTKDDLEKMKNLDIREVKVEDLVQLKSIKINPKDTKEKRLGDYLKQVKNPYFVGCDKCVVKLTYSENEVTLEDCVMNYLKGL